MKRSPLAVSLAAVLLLAGCGGSDGSPQATPSSSEPSASETPLTEAQLKTALVKQADLPAGYVADTSDDDDDDIEIKASTAACQEKYDVLDALDDGEGVKAEANFQKGDGRVSLKHEWEAVDDSLAELKLEFITIRSLFKDCPKVSLISTDGTPPITVTFGALDLPKLGEDSLGLSARGEFQGIKVAFAFAFVRVGHNVQTVFQGGLGEPDLALINKISALGIQRLPKA
jgi:major membrane immunogen (membrane-anchored lipoprotein)